MHDNPSSAGKKKNKMPRGDRASLAGASLARLGVAYKRQHVGPRFRKYRGSVQDFLEAHVQHGLGDRLFRLLVMKPLGLERIEELPVRSLSGGEVQMLVIGRGLMASPKMLMLDEPSAALAPKVVLEIFANINRIAKSGVTMLVVEQNVRMALILAQYGYIIRDGVIMMEGEADHLISDPAVKESFLGGSVANTSKVLRN